MSDTDFDFEPMRGIPAPLPDGESLLWQGSPNWKRLASRPFRIKWVAAWFAVLAAWPVVGSLVGGTPLGAKLPGIVITLLLGAIACGILAALAWLTARVTVYSITSQRVLIRFGIALQVTMNLPFRRIESASLSSPCAESGDPAGDIALALVADERASYFVLWPHVRPGSMSRAQPLLRALDDARTPARILAEAVAQAGIAPRADAPSAAPAARPDGEDARTPAAPAALVS